MFKTTIAAAAAAIALAPAAALAGPYVNVETNAGWVGDDYTAATTDLHVGFEGEAGAASYYVQACLLYTSDAADDLTCRSRWSPYH